MVEWRTKSTDVNEVTLWIEGSNDLRDWIFNFATGRTIWPGGVRVNKWDRYEALIVLRWLRRTYNSDVRFRVGGVSRGGAIAQIVAFELDMEGRLDELQTFGTKRTGNKKFVDHLDPNLQPGGDLWVVHWRNRMDVVPFLPPWYARLPLCPGLGTGHQYSRDIHLEGFRTDWDYHEKA